MTQERGLVKLSDTSGTPVIDGLMTFVVVCAVISACLYILAFGGVFS